MINIIIYNVFVILFQRFFGPINDISIFVNSSQLTLVIFNISMQANLGKSKLDQGHKF